MGRRLGQHFLVRKSILERIASAACPEFQPSVVEIGAGRGELTQYLLPRAAKVVAIETDPVLVEQLRSRLGAFPGLMLVEGDVLEIDLGQWSPAVIVGNLPYYISSPILRKILALGPLLRHAVLLLQKEFAGRLVAGPGSRRYGFVSVETQLSAIPEILFHVKASAFRPPPKVDSSVVRLRPRQLAPPLEVQDMAKFLDFAKRCFRCKRKTLRNNLAQCYERSALDSCAEATLRAEQLSIEQLAQLFRHLER